MINFAPLDDIRREYGHLKDLDAYRQAFVEQLTPEGVKLLQESDEVSFDNRVRQIRFYDYIASRDTTLPRYAWAGCTEILVPEVLASISGSSRVLDIGYLDGLCTILYALNMPDASFVGIDISKESVKLASRNMDRYQVRNVKFLPADVMNLPFRESFDAVVATNVLSETYQLYRMGEGLQVNTLHSQKLDQIKSVSKPGAKIVLSFEPDFIDAFEARLVDSFRYCGLEIVDVKPVRFRVFDKDRTMLYAVARKPL